MRICYQKKKQVIYTEACPEVTLRALAASAETKLLTDCCRLAIRYAEEEPTQIPDWFSKRFMKFCKDMTKENGNSFLNKTNRQKLLLFSEYEKGEHPFINFCASGYDESEVLDKKTKTKKKGPWRKQKYVHLSGLVAIDIDHLGTSPDLSQGEGNNMSLSPQALFQKWQKEVDFKALKIYLIYITPREGLRVVFRCDVTRGNLMSNQEWMCQKLGVVPDSSCKDASRGFFLTSAENFLYDDLKQMYEDEADEAFIKKYEPEYRAGKTSSSLPRSASGRLLPAGRKKGEECLAGSKVAAPSPLGRVGERSIWRGYDIQGIIDQRYAAKLPCAEDSNRHKESLKLATDLLMMLDGDKRLVQQIIMAQSWVKEIIDERNENVEQTVESASECVAQKERRYASSQPSKVMLAAIKAATGKTYQEIVRDRVASETSEDGQGVHPMMGYLMEWGAEIEKFFDVYPCLREICQGLHQAAYPAALFVGAAFLGTDMTRTWYYFYHNPEEERRLNYCIYIIGDPAVGKSFATRLYKLLAAPLIAADKMSNDAINRYKKNFKERGTSSKEQKKEALKQPEVIVRVHGARTANGVFIEDMNNAVELVGDKEMHLHLLTFDSELDSSTNASKGGQWIDKSTMELKAFHNEEDNQQYKNVDSVTGPFDVYWNYVYTGTPLSLRKKVTEANFGSGLSTRLGCIPMPGSNFKMMPLRRHSSVDYQANELLKTWAYRLDRVNGELPVWPLVEDIWQWTSDRLLMAEIDEDKADEMLIKRVGYYGIAITTPFILMRHWDEWEQGKTFTIDETDKAFCQLVLNIQYQTQHYFFGKYARNYFDNMETEANTNKRRRTKTRVAFDNLPEVFRAEDVVNAYNTNADNARVIICRLRKDGFVEKTEEGTFKKIVRLL